MSRDGGEIASIASRVSAAALEIAAHTIVVCIILISIFAIERLIYFLWGDKKLLFDRIPIKYLFDLADVCTLACFLIVGLWSSLRAFQKAGEPQ